MFKWGRRGVAQLIPVGALVAVLVIGKVLPRGITPLIILSVGAIVVVGPALAFSLFKFSWLVPLIIIIGLLSLLRR